MSEPLLLLDIDNTLYDWPAFFAPSFRALIHVLHRELGVPEEELYLECKDVFAARQSLEYAFVIQELACVQNRPTEDVRRLIELGRGAFKSVQRARLQPYVGVLNTLEWFRLHGAEIVGVTNSPMYRAQQRLYDLRLDKYFSGLVAFEGFEPSVGDPATEGYVTQGRQRHRSRIKRRVLVPEADCKPNSKHYRLALEAFSASSRDAWAVGDSLAKDLAPAAAVGIRTVWARYGSRFDPDDKNMATILRVTHWTESVISTAYAAAEFSPDFTIDAFDELREVVPIQLTTLF